MGPTWGLPGPCRPQIGPWWPHEPCYKGSCIDLASWQGSRTVVPSMAAVRHAPLFGDYVIGCPKYRFEMPTAAVDSGNMQCIVWIPVASQMPLTAPCTTPTTGKLPTIRTVQGENLAFSLRSVWPQTDPRTVMNPSFPGKTNKHWPIISRLTALLGAVSHKEWNLHQWFSLDHRNEPQAGPRTPIRL